jgi:hypothetical protein
MAFSVIGAYVASAIGFGAVGSAAVVTIAGIGLSTAGLFVASAISLGLATITSRLINRGGGGGGTQQNQGTRQQLPPATDNKVPVIYGSVFTKAVVTDARLTDSNNVMRYVLILGEKTQTGTFTVGDIFWNDQKLVFGTGGGEEHIVKSTIDQAGLGDSYTKLADKIEVRVYAGSTTSTNQIFPSVNQTSALTMLGESDANYQLNGLVFAVVKLTYDQNNGVTALQPMTFQITNSLNNPGDVWYDYMTSNRYGAGFTSTQIDTNSCIGIGDESLKSYSNTVPSNQFTYWPPGTTSTAVTTATSQVRYQINGVLSTGDTVKNNIERISQACSTWTTFDFTQGKWKVIVNRPATVIELGNAFVFDDSNIIGEININATNLEDLYNQLEVEFPSRVIRDQNDYFKDELAASELNDLEPNNLLNMRLDMLNNAIHAGRVGYIELLQSRVDLVITFKADYSALQVEAGDVVKITNSIYGFNEKLFRVTRTKEVEGEDGSLIAEVTALEYDSTVYADQTLVDSANPGASGISNSSSLIKTPSAPTITNVISTGTLNPSFTLNSVVGAGGLPIDQYQFFYRPITTSTWSSIPGANNPPGFTANAGQTFSSIVAYTEMPTGLGTYTFAAKVGAVGIGFSDISSASASLTWNPQPNNDQGTV